MFNFEEWSEKVLFITGSLEQPRSEAEAITYQTQLEQLWKEMIHQENDVFIQFLQTILMKTKELSHGELEQTRYHQIVEELRESILKDI